MLKITGYPDRYSVAPGETIGFKISLEEGDRFDARIVRVVHGDCNPAGPGLKFPHVPSPVDGNYAGRPQRIDAGSYMRVDALPALGGTAFTFSALVWPTLPQRPDQTLLAQWDPGAGAGRSGEAPPLSDARGRGTAEGGGEGNRTAPFGNDLLQELQDPSSATDASPLHHAGRASSAPHGPPPPPSAGEEQAGAIHRTAERTQRGFRIGIDAGRLFLAVAEADGGTETVTTHKPMLRRQWYRICVALDPAIGRYVLDQVPLERFAQVDDADHVEGVLKVRPSSVATAAYLAGCPQAGGTVGRHYDGKLEAPLLLAGMRSATDCQAAPKQTESRSESAIAAWDFSRGIATTTVTDIGPSGHHGTLVHLPARGMKGATWTGEAHDFKAKPDHYGAIHFHHDDLYDAGWETSLTFTVPSDLKSGAYALHLSCGPSDETATREDYLAFFVRPPRIGASGAARPKVALLAPTASYMAYANHGEHITARGAEMQMNRLLTFGHADLYMYEHPELGGSLYDCHADGSGVCTSSRLRPVLNFSPRYHSWLGGHGSALYQYNADTHLFDWLDHRGVDYDLITDEDLHQDGLELLKPYRVILTGTHPEYHSTAMWDAMKAWIDGGGRLMYMGGNGWYWRIAFHDTLPGVIELRRAEDGIRTWIAEPGEYYQSFNGEYGGLWRRLGRPPNRMCGVGFIAQGFDVSSYYRRLPDADNPRAAWIFEDVPDEIIGDFGLIGGGAAGIELDCISQDLGAPPNMLRLASSDGHSPMMMLVNEEFGVVPPNLGGDVNPRVHADLAFGETAAGGALFATSSIAWCGSLSHNRYDNNVSRISWNVLRRFLDETPFPIR